MTYAFIFFLVDFIYLIVFGLYLDNILGNVGGIKKPLYYFLLPSYWQRNSQNQNKRNNNSVYIELLNAPNSDTNIDENYEQVTENLRELEDTEEILKIKRLNKSFGEGDILAVDNLTMNLYSGQIFALLGHNGTGKTTILSLLTGLLKPNSGFASAFGIPLFEERDKAQKIMGLCPQHEILYDDLTIGESLRVFGM